MRKLSRFAIVPVAMLAMIALAACTEADEQRRQSIEARATTFERAQQIAPLPQPQNFPLRKALVAFTERQDLINHPWYIYVLGMDGTYVGYFVGQTYPINACNFLSSSQDVSGSNDSVVLDAPSLDGIFYGGGGASSACDVYFFFDTETNAMQTFKAPMFFASDSPLDLDVPRLNSTQEITE